ncbi:MAG: tRNA (adenosine(37)-N6)-threonylcarbamoyltransferase complex ATPase subunit type 1 TsaE, partial [Candidatus Omnitrophota bacterium]
MLKIISDSPKETSSLGKNLAKYLKKGSVVALFGNLGAGKTVLVKGIAQGLGFNKRFVCSPTFTLIKEYLTRIPLYHFDL